MVRTFWRLVRAVLSRMLALLGIAVVLGLLFLFYIRFDVSRQTKRYTYKVADAPADRTVMILGAVAYNHDTPSPVLAARLDTAIDLFAKGKADLLLMSGDGRADDYNEVVTMRNYALQKNIPADSIRIDDQGLRTYDSCYRAKYVLKVERLTVVTQSDHLTRALYLCRSMGIDAVGVAASGRVGGGGISSFMREESALVLAWLEAHIFHPAS